MKKQIWKFKVIPSGKNVDIEMPRGAEILSMHTQDEQPCIWALVNPDAKIETRRFEVYGTGHDIHYDMGVERNFIGTCLIHGGLLVLHIFERIN